MKRIIQSILLFLFALSPHIFNQSITQNNTHNDFLFNISKPSDLKKQSFDLDQRILEKINFKFDNPPLNLNFFSSIFYKTFLNGNVLLSEYYSQSWGINGWRNYNGYTFTYDRNSNCIKIVSKIGDNLETDYKQSLYTYDNNKNVIENVIQQWDSTKWNNQIKYSYSYNGNNYYTEVVVQSWDSTAWQLKNRLVFEYDDNNNEIKRISQYFSNGDWINVQMFVNAYDDNNNLTEVLWQLGNGTGWSNQWKESYEYSGATNVIEYLNQDWDGANWVNFDRELYKYDGHNNNIERLVQDWKDSSWVNIVRNIYTYNENNYKTSDTYENYFWDSIWVSIDKRNYMYDNRGNCIQVLDQGKNLNDSVWIDFFRGNYTYDIYNNITSLQSFYKWDNADWVSDSRIIYIIIPKNGTDGNINNYWLANNYPNPFNNSTIIRYLIPKEELVTIKIFNILGEQVDLLLNESKQAGVYEVPWNPTNLPSGIYFYQLKAGDFTKTKKMILLK